MKRIYAVFGLLILSVIFIMIGHAYREQIQSRLKQPLITIMGKTYDWWSLSHLLLYMLIGYITPDRYVLFTGIGIAWELVEDYLSADRSTQLVNCTDPKNKGHVWCNGIQNDYWYMEKSDVFVNVLGYFAGSLAHAYTHSTYPFGKLLSD